MGDRPGNHGDKNWLDQLLQGVPQGMRHISAVRLVGWAYAKGFSCIEVEYLIKGWNKHNLPPIGDYEIETILRSTVKWENRRYVPPMSDEEVNEILKLVDKDMRKRR